MNIRWVDVLGGVAWLFLVMGHYAICYIRTSVVHVM